MALAGDSVDIMWTHPELIAQLYTANALAPLDDAIAGVGQDLKANISEEYWPNVTIKGKTYGVPAVVPGVAAGYTTYIIRADLREKYGLPEIKTEADMSAFWETVKKNNPELVPLSLGVGPGNISDHLKQRKEVYTRGVPVGTAIDISTNKVIKVYDYPEFTVQLKMTRDRYNKGYVSKDVLSVKDFKAPFIAGKSNILGG
jgi:putative aldouronate transport system substrate-binding protein